MLKKDLILKLTELGITYNPRASAAELEALLPQEAPAPSTTTTAAAVHTKGGAHIRTYTREDHGDEFEKLAAEFSAHTPESVVHVR